MYTHDQTYGIHLHLAFSGCGGHLPVPDALFRPACGGCGGTEPADVQKYTGCICGSPLAAIREAVFLSRLSRTVLVFCALVQKALQKYLALEHVHRLDSLWLSRVVSYIHLLLYRLPWQLTALSPAGHPHAHDHEQKIYLRMADTGGIRHFSSALPLWPARFLGYPGTQYRFYFEPHRDVYRDTDESPWRHSIFSFRTYAASLVLCALVQESLHTDIAFEHVHRLGALRVSRDMLHYTDQLLRLRAQINAPLTGHPREHVQEQKIHLRMAAIGAVWHLPVAGAPYRPAFVGCGYAESAGIQKYAGCICERRSDASGGAILLSRRARVALVFRALVQKTLQNHIVLEHVRRLGSLWRSRLLPRIAAFLYRLSRRLTAAPAPFPIHSTPTRRHVPHEAALARCPEAA